MAEVALRGRRTEDQIYQAALTEIAIQVHGLCFEEQGLEQPLKEPVHQYFKNMETQSLLAQHTGFHFFLSLKLTLLPYENRQNKICNVKCNFFLTFLIAVEQCWYQVLLRLTTMKLHNSIYEWRLQRQLSFIS